MHFLSPFWFLFKTRHLDILTIPSLSEAFSVPKTSYQSKCLSAAWRRSSLSLCWCRWVCWCSSCTIYGLSIPSYTTLFELLLALMLSLAISGFLPWWVWVFYIITFSLSLSIHSCYYKFMLWICGCKVLIAKDDHTTQLGHWWFLEKLFLLDKISVVLTVHWLQSTCFYPFHNCVVSLSIHNCYYKFMLWTCGYRVLITKDDHTTQLGQS